MKLLSRGFELHSRRSMAGQSGETLISLLVTLILVGIAFAAITSSFFDSSKHSMDLQIKSRAEEQAKAVLEMMGFDLRMMGSGMPLGQSTFQIGGSGLGTAPLPVMETSTASNIVFRLNELGNNTVLTSAYTPSSTSLQFTVLSASDLAIGTMIYINNMLVGGTVGLQGSITAISGNNVTIDSSYIATSGAVFKAGSTVDRVSTITYDSPSDWSGITRNNGTGAVIITPNSTFTLEYRDGTGTPITLPLTDTAVASNLSSIKLTVNVRGEHVLSDGTTYSADASQVVALRNLNMNR